MQNRHKAYRQVQNVFSSKDIRQFNPPIQRKSASPIVRRPVRSQAAKPRQRQDKNIGGAERDRTADPLLAKQVLSQLSYSPNLSIDRLPHREWWARADSNCRPHAYQACALTT